MFANANSVIQFINTIEYPIQVDSVENTLSLVHQHLWLHNKDLLTCHNDSGTSFLNKMEIRSK